MGDEPFDLPPAVSPDLYNMVPRDYEGLDGIQSRPSVVQCARQTFDGSPGFVTTVTNEVEEGIFWPLAYYLVFSERGKITRADNGAGALASALFTSADVGEIWTFAIAPNSLNVETLWAMPTSHGIAPTAPPAPQKWDGVAATTSAWGGGVPPLNVAATNRLSPGGILYWKNRMLVWNPAGFKNRLCYSDKGNPESPATANYGNNFIDFPDDDSSVGIVQCIAHQESLVVFKKKGIWQVFDPSTFANKRLVTGAGCAWRGQACSHPNGRFYWISGYDGHVYSMSLRGDIAMESYRLRRMIASKAIGNAAEQLLLSPKGSIIWIPGLTGAGDGDVYEFIPKQPGEGAWFRHKFTGAGSKNHWFVADFRDPAIIGTLGSAGGRILEFFTRSITPGGTDAAPTGAAVNMNPAPYVKSGWRPFLSEEPIERVRRVHVIGAGSFTLDMFAEANPKLTPVAKFSGSLSLGALTDRSFSTQRPETHGRYHAFKLTGAAGVGFVVDELEFAFRGGKEHTG